MEAAGLLSFARLHDIRPQDVAILPVNLMFFWPCIINLLCINYQSDALIIIYS